MIRKDMNDLVYRTADEKWQGGGQGYPRLPPTRPAGAGRHHLHRGQRVPLRSVLTKEGLPHQVLNAKQHDREAQVVAQAGLPGGITIATNMAGRGTDIVLGGSINKEIDAIQRRRQSQPRKKTPTSGSPPLKAAWKVRAMPPSLPPAACTSSVPSVMNRAGWTISCAAAPVARAIPGSSRFYLSLEDPLLRIFGGDRLKAIMEQA
jgi:preprotein translocase subunit SecA